MVVDILIFVMVWHPSAILISVMMYGMQLRQLVIYCVQLRQLVYAIKTAGDLQLRQLVYVVAIEQSTIIKQSP